MSDYRYFDQEASDTCYKTSLSAIIGQLMGRYDVSRTLSGRLPYLLGALAAVETYQTNTELLRHDDVRRVEDTLSRTTLSVEVANNGRVTTSVDVGQEAHYNPHICYGRPVQNVTVKKKWGRTIYQIQNLNIYITAEVVEQLNVNPQEVVNYLHERIQEEIKIQEEINRMGR